MFNRSSRLICLVAVLIVPDLTSAEVSVAPATSVEAIRLGNTALEHFRAERWDAALSAFRAADATMHSPVFGFYIARCLRQLGRWHEAVDVLKGVTDGELRPDAPEPWRQARQDSRRELEEMNESFPTLTVRLLTESRTAGVNRREHIAVSNDDAETRAGSREGRPQPRGAEQVDEAVSKLQPVVNVDGHALDLTNGLGQIRLDPGMHRLTVMRGTLVLESRSIEIAPARAARVVDLGPYPEPIATEARAQYAPPKSRASVEQPAQPRKRESGRLMRHGAYASLGVGILGACVGTVAGLLAWHDRNALLGRCGGWTCPAGESSHIEKGRVFGQISTAAFVTSAIGFTGSVTLFLLAPAGVRTESGVGLGYSSAF